MRRDVYKELGQNLLMFLTLVVTALLFALIWIGLNSRPHPEHSEPELILSTGQYAVEGTIRIDEAVDVSCEINLGGCDKIQRFRTKESAR